MTKRLLVLTLSAVIVLMVFLPFASAEEDRDTRTVIRLDTDAPTYAPLRGLEIESVIGGRSRPRFGVRMTLGKKEIGHISVEPGKKQDERVIKCSLFPDKSPTVPASSAGRIVMLILLRMIQGTSLEENLNRDYISSLFDEVIAFDGGKLSRVDPMRLYDLTFVGEMRAGDFCDAVSGLLGAARDADLRDTKADVPTADFKQTVGSEISFFVDLDKTVSLSLNADAVRKVILPYAEDIDWFFNLPKSESFALRLRERIEKYPDKEIPMLVSFDREEQPVRILIGRACPGTSDDMPFAFSMLRKIEASGKTRNLCWEYDAYSGTENRNAEVNRYLYVLRENNAEQGHEHDSCVMMLVPSLGSAQASYHIGSDLAAGVNVTELDTATDRDGVTKKGGIRITENADGSFEILINLYDGQSVTLTGTVEKES